MKKPTTFPAIDHKLELVQEAQHKYSTFTQEQVNIIFKEAAMAANEARLPLAVQAVEETGMGIVVDKVVKNHFASEIIYHKYHDLKTCGVVESDPLSGYEKVAKPIGIVAGFTPVTNPTSTAVFKALICLLTRNGFIVESRKMHHRGAAHRARCRSKSWGAQKHHQLGERIDHREIPVPDAA